MANFVTFFSPKGGQGKTTLAALYALKTNSIYYTNDYKTGMEHLLKDLFPAGNFRRLDDSTTEINHEDDEKVVFDFGGFVDMEIVPPILKVADLCIIPLMYQSQFDLQPFFIGLKAVEEINKNILVVINNTDSSLINVVKEGLEQEISHPIKVVRRSSYMTYIGNEKISPFDIHGVYGASAKALISLKEQLTSLFQFIEEY
jgi:hypothetical protein